MAKIEELLKDWITKEEFKEIWINMDDNLDSEELKKLKDTANQIQEFNKKTIFLDAAKSIATDNAKIQIENLQLEIEKVQTEALVNKWQQIYKDFSEWNIDDLAKNQNDIFDTFWSAEMPDFLRKLLFGFIRLTDKVSWVPIIWDQLWNEINSKFWLDWYENMYNKFFMEICWRLSVNYMKKFQKDVPLLVNKDLSEVKFDKIKKWLIILNAYNIDFTEKDFWKRFLWGETISSSVEYVTRADWKYKVEKTLKNPNISESDFENNKPSQGFYDKINNVSFDIKETKISEEEWKAQEWWETKVNTEKFANAWEFAKKAKEVAQQLETKYWIPWEVTLWQAALESWNGKSSLSSKYNNYFWVKYYWKDKSLSANMATKEESWWTTYSTNANFRVYENMYDSFEWYARTLSADRYKNAFKYASSKEFCKTWNYVWRNPRAFVQEIRNWWYATDSQYVNKVVSRLKTFWVEI